MLEWEMFTGVLELCKDGLIGHGHILSCCVSTVLIHTMIPPKLGSDLMITSFHENDQNHFNIWNCPNIDSTLREERLCITEPL